MAEVNELASLMRSLRHQLDLSQGKFAARLRVSIRTVNRWENGHAKPSRVALDMLEAKLKEANNSGASVSANTNDLMGQLQKIRYLIQGGEPRSLHHHH